MKYLLVTACLLTLIPMNAAADEGGQVPLQGPPKHGRAHCCNAKGALIGAGIGVGLAVFLVRHTCDSSDCTSAYLGASAVLGGIGAGLGAWAGGPSRQYPLGSPDTRVVVSPAIARRAHGAIVAVRF